MSRGDNLRILDVLDAASEVAAIVADGKDSFLTNSVSQRAVERLLEIIGEAANLISDEVKGSFPQVDWRDCGFRGFSYTRSD